MKSTRLSRLREALRARDWLGIVIELVVVTLGVLLAFQVDQWGDRHKQAQDEYRFLERLYMEYHRSLAELDEVDRDNQKIRRNIREALAARGDQARLEALSRRSSFGCGIARLRSANFNDTSFEELIASGRLNLISDPALRSEARDLAASQATSARQVEYSRELMLNQLPYLDPYYRYNIHPDGAEQCWVDWPALVKDPRAVNAIARAYRTHGFVLEERQKVRARTNALIHRLACKLSKPECVRGS